MLRYSDFTLCYCDMVLSAMCSRMFHEVYIIIYRWYAAAETCTVGSLTVSVYLCIYSCMACARNILYFLWTLPLSEYYAVCWISKEQIILRGSAKLFYYSLALSLSNQNTSTYPKKLIILLGVELQHVLTLIVLTLLNFEYFE